MENTRRPAEPTCSFRGISTDVAPNLSTDEIIRRLLESAQESLGQGDKQVPTFFAFFEKTVEIFHIVDAKGSWRAELMPKAFVPYVAKRKPDKVAFVAQGIVQQLSAGMSKALERGSIGLGQIPSQKTLTIFVESRTEYAQVRYHIGATSDGVEAVGGMISYETSAEVSPTKRPEFTFYDTLPQRAVYH